MLDAERGRAARREPGEAEPAGDRLDLARELRPREPLLLEAEGDVLGDREVGPQRPLLEHVAEATRSRRQEGDVLAVDQHAAARHRQEARDRPQHVGLPRLGRAEEGEELAVAHVDADLVDARRAPAARAERLEADVHERPGRAGRPAHAPATARPIQVSVAVASSGPIARIWKGRLTYTNDQAKVPRNIATGRL